MNIIRIVERRFGRLLGRGVSGPSGVDRTPPTVAIRLCQYGHAVFEGNNLCTYGHRPV